MIILHSASFPSTIASLPRRPELIGIMCSDEGGGGGMPNSTNPLHLLFVPLFAQGHMIPMLDLARLLATRGVLITFVTTPVNLARIRPIADRAAASALPIRFADLNFPAVEAGLPEGSENIDLLRSIELFIPFMNALALLRDPLLAHLNDTSPAHWPRPAGIVSDNLNHWTVDVARTFGIPRLVFHGPSCFYLLCSLLIHRNKPELEAAIEAASGGPITLPGLPQPIRVSKHQVVADKLSSPAWSKLIETVREAEESADGVLVNSFAELEPWYMESYREAINKPVWPIGPVSLYKEESDAKAARGQTSSIDNVLLFQWLDGQEAGSVVFVSFGSIALNSPAQLVELGHGLESSGRPFLWVVKEVAAGRDAPAVLEEWLAELDKRLDGRGLVIRGWAPQAAILSHAAIGGFVTHCGWNSILESVAAGVVMATWPHFADQFLNERLVVDVLQIGVAVGVDEPTRPDVEGPVKVRRGEVEAVLERLMGEEEEAKERRERARELGNKAKRAMEEGGSSWRGLHEVISYVSQYGKNNK